MSVPEHLGAALPAQKIARSKKTEAWRKQNVEAIAGFGVSNNQQGRTTIERKQIAYNLVNSIVDESDYEYVLDPYSQGSKAIGDQPAQLRNINLILPKLQLLKGEEMSRPFNYQVMAVNGEAVSFKEEEMKRMLLKTAQEILAKESGIPEIQQMGPDGQPKEPQTFEQVEKYARHSITDIREQFGSHILRYLEYKELLPSKFNDGWNHALIAAEEIYYIGVVNGEPRVRTCNPLNCDFDRNPDNPNIEDGDWFKEERSMTTGQVLDEFGEYLTEAEVKLLDEGKIRDGLQTGTQTGFAYTQQQLDSYDRNGLDNRYNSANNHYRVVHVVWKSMKKIGFVSYEDENGDPQDGIVDETYKLSEEQKELGYEIEWRWIPEVWQGTRIGKDIYVKMEPMPSIGVSVDTPSDIKLPYVGTIYNCVNSTQTSLVDLLKPHQYLYNIIWFRLEAEIAKAKGKKLIMDIAQIPKSQGIDLDKWMYMFDNVGIGFINSFEEGEGSMGQGKASQFNQFTSVDMTLSKSIGQYVEILTKIEQLIDKIIGITPQREGATSASETATGTRAAINNSSYITEPWFYVHNEVKKKVLTRLLETAKYAYPDSKKLNYIVNDVERVFVNIDVEKFADSDYGVFITNSAKDNMAFQKLEQLAQMALSSDKANLSDIISMYNANSISELSNKIEASEQKKYERDATQQEAQQEMQQQQIQAAAQEKELEREFIAEQNQLDREAKLQEAAIKVTGFDTDTADNDSLDAIEQSKLMIEQSRITNEQAQKDNDRNTEVNEREKDRQLKREELRSKEEIEKLKARTALKNKTSGEK